MKKLLLIITLFIGAFSISNAQEYRNGIGIRGVGIGGGGITFKHFYSASKALEFHAYGSGDFRALSILHEWHWDLNSAGLQWFAGVGGTIYSFRDGKRYNSYRGNSIAACGIIGLDYKFQGAPIGLQLDYKPTLAYGPGFIYDEVALSVRFTF